MDTSDRLKSRRLLIFIALAALLICSWRRFARPTRVVAKTW